ncbi:hypothetical protein DVH24_039018 [Malus domestica]|uniref:Uncharacterized protein n=1 Tax=Malus domestica TaxID=3750 RepID=A0A498KEC3_MALDO|nr:hypothetical protein DVH24_039018 [Malus domestica]
MLHHVSLSNLMISSFVSIKPFKPPDLLTPRILNPPYSSSTWKGHQSVNSACKCSGSVNGLAIDHLVPRTCYCTSLS